jgi:hypothetical protein
VIAFNFRQFHTFGYLISFSQFAPSIIQSKPARLRKYAYHRSLGVFVANADGSLVLATSGTISSDFNDLGSAGWLITSYTLAMCAAQSLVSSPCTYASLGDAS